MERVVRKPNLVEFKCAVLLNKRKVQIREWRNYLTKRWETLTKGMKNATVLILAGRHGDDHDDGKIAPIQGNEDDVLEGHDEMVSYT